MEVGQHGIHLVSPDRLCHHVVPAVHLALPQHLAPWKRGVATMQQQCLGAPKKGIKIFYFNNGTPKYLFKKNR